MHSTNGQMWGSPMAPGSPQRVGKKILGLEPRYQIVVLCFFATFTAYVERVGFSIAYTEMAKAANVDEAVKGGVLSAFFWGYGVSQVCLSLQHPLQSNLAVPSIRTSNSSSLHTCKTRF
jgi:hypothetical protein